MPDPADRTPRPHLTILGAGVAGLAVGHYAAKRALPFTILESSGAIGGLCRTLRHESGCAFDLGAHRFHDKDPVVTGDALALMGGRMHRVSVPSHVWHRGRLMPFPPSATALVSAAGPLAVATSVAGMLAARLWPLPARPSFEDIAVRSYGRGIASLFLLNYSEKLWGAPCSRLSPVVGGGRLKGLTARAALAEALAGPRSRAPHVDGSFYYPEEGIGALADALAASCGAAAIRTGTRVTKVVHDGRQITAVNVNGAERLPVDRLVSTLPLPAFVRLFDPPLDVSPPALQFRHLRLTVLVLSRPAVTSSATLYFPDPAFPFTRVYEPRNRSARLAPTGRTALVAEVPCGEGDQRWSIDDAALVSSVVGALKPLGWFKADEIVDSLCVRVPAAYPVIDLDAEDEVQRLRECLACFDNLALAGRAGRFEYAWIHTLMRQARDEVTRIGEGRSAETRRYRSPGGSKV